MALQRSTLTLTPVDPKSYQAHEHWVAQHDFGAPAAQLVAAVQILAANAGIAPDDRGCTVRARIDAGVVSVDVFRPSGPLVAPVVLVTVDA